MGAGVGGPIELASDRGLAVAAALLAWRSVSEGGVASSVREEDMNKVTLLRKGTRKIGNLLRYG